MSDKKIIVIGAGIAGLSAGCYTQMNGFETQIFEMHNLPGGQCTSWRRKGFVFDGCIHHLAGCKPGSSLYSMWRELGALPERPVIFPEHICRVEDPSEKELNVYTDLDRLKEHMLELSPQDSNTINNYIKGAKTFTKFDMLDTPLLRGVDFLKRFLKLLTLMKWRLPMKEYAVKFKDPFLRKAFPTIQYDSPDTPMLAHLNILGNSHTRNYGVPIGGSLEFSQAIEKRYLKLGGRINYNSRVEKILVEGNHAVGVRLAGGSEYRSDVVISDVFAPAAIFGLLNGKYVDESIKRQFSKPVDIQGMGIQVSFGLARDLSKMPRALVFFLEKPVKIADREHDRLVVEMFGYDSSLAPAGKSVLKVPLTTSYSYWNDLHKHPEKYGKEKQRVAETVLKVLEKRFPCITEQVEAVDVATPMTMERYTGVSQAYESDLGISDMISLLKGQPKTLPGLRGFFMIGSTIGTSGIPGCAAMGINLVEKRAHFGV
jgi:phytoene dehydrogenase-like protein